MVNLASKKRPSKRPPKKKTLQTTPKKKTPKKDDLKFERVVKLMLVIPFSLKVPPSSEVFLGIDFGLAILARLRIGPRLRQGEIMRFCSVAVQGGSYGLLCSLRGTALSKCCCFPGFRKSVLFWLPPAGVACGQGFALRVQPQVTALEGSITESLAAVTKPLELLTGPLAAVTEPLALVTDR